MSYPGQKKSPRGDKTLGTSSRHLQQRTTLRLSSPQTHLTWGAKRRDSFKSGTDTLNPACIVNGAAGTGSDAFTQKTSILPACVVRCQWPPNSSTRDATAPIHPLKQSKQSKMAPFDSCVTPYPPTRPPSTFSMSELIGKEGLAWQHTSRYQGVEE